MPTYQYRCTACGEDLEIFQKFTDPSLTVCPSCDGELRKVFNAVGVVFKGTGFYATDSRKSKSVSTPAAKSEPSSSGSDAPSTASTSSSTPAPAAG